MADFTTALIAAVVLGLVNAVIRPILILLTLPATIITLGLFIFVINGLLFWFVGSYLQGFTVSGFWPGVFGAIVYSIVSWALASVLLPERRVSQASSHHAHRGDGGGRGRRLLRRPARSRRGTK